MYKLIYTALSGQNAIDARMRQVANELANVNTTGFKRAYSAAMTTMRYDGDGWSSRFAATMQDSNAVDLTPGPSVATGRELDVALAPAQLFQVVLPDGSNVYTSRGDLMVGPDGTLRNGEGVAIAATGGGKGFEWVDAAGGVEPEADSGAGGGFEEVGCGGRCVFAALGVCAAGSEGGGGD